MDQAWLAVLDAEILKAKEEGLTLKEEANQGPGSAIWHCPFCERTVPESYLGTHLCSKDHVKWKQNAQARQEVLNKHARGGLPPWIELRDGWEFCTLCWSWWTEGHDASEKHRKRVLWYQEAQNPTPAAPVVEIQPTAANRTYSDPTYFNPDWGPPYCFEWRPADMCWYCKLCWKTADDSHCNSRKHLSRVQYPEMYLGDCVPGSAQVPQLPPGMAPPDVAFGGSYANAWGPAPPPAFPPPQQFQCPPLQIPEPPQPEYTQPRPQSPSQHPSCPSWPSVERTLQESPVAASHAALVVQSASGQGDEVLGANSLKWQLGAHQRFEF